MINKQFKFWSLIVAVFLSSFINVIAQDVKPEKGTVYKVNTKVELPVSSLLFLSNYIGFKYLDKKDRLTETEINALDADNIWFVDRIATQQDASKRESYHSASDWAMNITIALPALLALDKNIRRDWFDLLVLYCETHAMNSSVYLGVAAFSHRIRPYVYDPDIAMDEKISKGATESFWSGHTSTTAAASFFMAKVYSDYHPEIGNKKFLLYAAATIPPIVVGALRVKAMKHFPTDIAAGLVTGAAMGILIPQLHKVKQKTNLSFIPYGGSVNGLKIQYTLR